MIYVFLADGFEEVEAVATIDMLRRCELDVMTVGVGSQLVVGSHSMGLVCDADAKNLVPGDELQAVVLPGGMPGTLNLEDSDKVNEFLDFAKENDRFICAICAAPSILGHKGFLKNKKATCFPGFEKELDCSEYTGDFVTVDGKIITAKGAGAAIDFGLKIAEQFVGADKALKVGKSIQSKEY